MILRVWECLEIDKIRCIFQYAFREASRGHFLAIWSSLGSPLGPHWLPDGRQMATQSPPKVATRVTFSALCSAMEAWIPAKRENDRKSDQNGCPSDQKRNNIKTQLCLERGRDNAAQRNAQQRNATQRNAMPCYIESQNWWASPYNAFKKKQGRAEWLQRYSHVIAVPYSRGGRSTAQHNNCMPLS